MRNSRVKHSIVFCLLFIFLFITAANINCMNVYAAEHSYRYNTKNNYELYFSGSSDHGVYWTIDPFPVKVKNIPEGNGIKNATIRLYLQTSCSSGATLEISSPYYSKIKQHVEGSWKYYETDITKILQEQFRNNDRDFYLNFHGYSSSIYGVQIGCNNNDWDNNYEYYSPQLYLTYTDRPRLEFVEQPFNQKYTNKVPIKVTGSSSDNIKLRIVSQYHTATESEWHTAATSPYFSSDTYTHNWDISKIKFPDRNVTMRIRIEDEYGGYTDWQYKQFQVAGSPEINLTTADNQVISQNSGLNLTGTVKDADVNDSLIIKYTLDGIATNKVVTTLTANGNWQSFNKNVPIGTVTDGTKTLRVWVEDDTGNKSAETTRVVKIDNTGPKAFNPASSNITTGSIKATATTSDNVAGLDTNTGYRFYLNNTLARDWGTNSFTYSGLKPNTQYSLKVEARDKVNNTTMSGVLKKYTLAKTPTALKFTKTAETSVSLGWSANGNPAGTKYILERKESTGSYKAIASNLTTTSYSDSSLTPGKTYAYRVKAQNGDGVTTSYSNETTLVAVPSKPAAPTLTNNGVDKLNITWTKTTGATGYILYKGSTPIYTGSGLTYTDTVLATNTKYTYHLIATNSRGKGTAGNSASKYTLAKVPTDINISDIKETSVKLSWGSNGNPADTKYILERKESTGSYKAIASDLTTTSYSDNGLTPGKTYTYRVKAQNGNGVTTSYSNETTLVAVPDKPAAPTLTNNGVDKLNITWTKATGATEYILYRGSTVIYTGSGLTYTDTGLAINKKYTYHLIATNSRGKGTAGNSASKYTLAKVPIEITFFDIAETSASLSWSANGNPTGTKYILERKEGTGTYTVIASDLTETSYSDSGLTPGKTYTYRVKAQNGDGVDTTYSEESILVAVPDKPAAPTVTANGVDKFTITWAAVEGATEYILYRGDTSIYTGSELTFIDTGLAINTQYTYHLIASNVSGDSVAGDSAIKFTLAQVPADIAFSDITEISVSLSWSANGNPAGTKYILERKEGSGTYTAIASNHTGTSYSDKALTPGKTYTYRVKAQNGDGVDTAYSKERTLVAVPDKPTATTLTAKGVDKITVTWAAVEGATEYTLYRGDTAIYTGSELTFTDMGLTPNTQYTYYLVATNSSGTSAAGDSASKYTLAKKPVSLIKTASTADSITLEIENDPANGIVPQNKLIVKEKETGSIVKETGYSKETTALIDGLTEGAEYEVWLSTLNEEGEETVIAEEGPYIASIKTNNIPEITVNPSIQYIADAEGFNKVTVTGKVYDLDGDQVTVTVKINGNSKDNVITAPQTNNWSIDFDLDELGLADGEYDGEDVKITVTDGKNSKDVEYPKDSKIIVDREEPTIKPNGGFILNEGNPLLLGKDEITKGPKTSFRVEVEPSLSGPWKIELSNFPDFSQTVTYDFSEGELFIEHDKEIGFATASDAQVGREKTVYLRAYNRSGKYTEASKKVIKNALPEVKDLTLEPKLAGAYPQIRWAYQDEDKDLQKAYEIKVTAVSTGAEQTYTLEGDATTFTYDPKKFTPLDDDNYRITVRVQDDLNTWGTWAAPLDFNMNAKTDGIVTVDPSENPAPDKVYGIDGCTFHWEINKPCEVKVIIENAEQIAVRTIDEGKKDAGKYSTYWDAKDDAGKIVPLGEYTAYLELYDGVNRWKEELGKINIDPTPPIINVNTEIQEITNEDITIDLNIVDDSNIMGKVTVTDSEGNVIVNENITEKTYKKIITPDKDGEYIIRIEVTDEVGNKTALEKTVIYETQVPEIYVNYTPETSNNSTEITITLIDEYLAKVLVNKEEITFNATEANKYAAKATIALREGANDITITALDKAGNSAEKSISITYNPPKNNQGTITNPSEYEKKVDQVVEEINSDNLDNVDTVVDEVINSNLDTEDKKNLTGRIVDTLITDEEKAKLIKAYDIQEEVLNIDLNDPQGYLMMMEIKKKLLKNGYLNYIKIKTAQGEVVVLEKDGERYVPIDDAAKLLGIDTSKVRSVDSSFVFNTDQGTVIVNPDGSVIGHPEIKKLQVITDYGRIYVLVSDLERIFESDIKLTEIEDKHNSNEHWAYPYAQEIIDLYGIDVNVFGLDNEAPVELQQKLYDLMGLQVQARKSMTRFWMFYYLTENLNISADGDPDKILSKYDDYCDTCRKMNSTLIKAEKADFLNGRTWFDGTLRIAPKAPITIGELCSLTVKYLSMM